MSILSLDETLIIETQMSELDKDQGKTSTNNERKKLQLLENAPGDVNGQVE